MRGVHTEPNGRQSLVHFAYVAQHDKLVRVAVSIDDEIIATVHPDRNATKQWNRGNRSYFSRYQGLEERDAR